MMNWINENKEWFFSGGGVVFLGWLASYLLSENKKENKDEQKISSGKNSKNYQAGRDLFVTSQKDGYPDEK